MSKPFAEPFYKSTRWINCKNAYLSSVGGLCEICLKEGKITPADIVHHKVYINESNINNPDITLNWSNLQAVCQLHHNQIHMKSKAPKRYTVDKFGHVTITGL